MADVTSNAAQIDALTKSVRGLEQAQNRVVGTTKGFQQQMGLAEQRTAKLHQWWLGTRLGKLHTYAKMFANLSKVANKYTDDTEELEHAKRNLTDIQRKLLLPMLEMLPLTKRSQKMMKGYRNTLGENATAAQRLWGGFLRLSGVIFSFIAILAIIGFAWAIFSMAVQGADSSIVTMTENYGPLHDAMIGMAAIVSGEGGAGIFQTMAGGALLIAAAFLILPTAIAPFVIALIFARFMFKKLEDAGFGTIGSLIGGVGTFLVTLYAMLRPVKVIRFLGKILGHVIKFAGKGISFLKTRLPTLGKFILQTIRWLFSSGIAFIVVGIAMLIAYATGRVDGWLGTLVGLVGAALLAIGIFLSGVVLLVPALIIGALAFILAWVYRNWNEIKETLGAGLEWLGEQGSALLSGAATFVTDTVPGILGDAKDAIIKFVKDTDWWGIFEGIAEALGGGILGGIKAIINAMIGLMNIVGENMPTFSLPDWELLGSLAGASLDLSFKIPELADGGIVTAPTLALIGEAGPEAVVPLDGKHGVSNTINLSIDVSGVTDRSDKRALAREISDLINQELRRAGGQPTRGRY